MANNLVRCAVQQAKSKVTPALTQVRGAHHEHTVDPIKEKIGKREIVGFGMNGQPNYLDRVDFPMPAIRYKEVTPDIQVCLTCQHCKLFLKCCKNGATLMIRYLKRRRRETGKSLPLKRRRCFTGHLSARLFPR